jgi:hypothetical protein
MHRKTYLLIGLSANLLVTLTNQSAMGFTRQFGKGATSRWC